MLQLQCSLEGHIPAAWVQSLEPSGQKKDLAWRWFGHSKVTTGKKTMPPFKVLQKVEANGLAKGLKPLVLQKG